MDVVYSQNVPFRLLFDSLSYPSSVSLIYESPFQYNFWICEGHDVSTLVAGLLFSRSVHIAFTLNRIAIVS